MCLAKLKGMGGVLCWRADLWGFGIVGSTSSTRENDQRIWHPSWRPTSTERPHSLEQQSCCMTEGLRYLMTTLPSGPSQIQLDDLAWHGCKPCSQSLAMLARTQDPAASRAQLAKTLHIRMSCERLWGVNIQERKGHIN